MGLGTILVHNAGDETVTFKLKFWFGLIDEKMLQPGETGELGCELVFYDLHLHDSTGKYRTQRVVYGGDHQRWQAVKDSGGWSIEWWTPANMAASDEEAPLAPMLCSEIRWDVLARLQEQAAMMKVRGVHDGVRGPAYYEPLTQEKNFVEKDKAKVAMFASYPIGLPLGCNLIVRIEDLDIVCILSTPMGDIEVFRQVLRDGCFTFTGGIGEFNLNAALCIDGRCFSVKGALNLWIKSVPFDSGTICFLLNDFSGLALTGTPEPGRYLYYIVPVKDASVALKMESGGIDSEDGVRRYDVTVSPPLPGNTAWLWLVVTHDDILNIECADRSKGDRPLLDNYAFGNTVKATIMSATSEDCQEENWTVTRVGGSPSSLPSFVLGVKNEDQTRYLEYHEEYHDGSGRVRMSEQKGDADREPDEALQWVFFRCDKFPSAELVSEALRYNGISVVPRRHRDDFDAIVQMYVLDGADAGRRTGVYRRFNWRIDFQGDYYRNAAPWQNVQVQVGVRSYACVQVPVNVHVLAARIRQAMHDSQRTLETIRLD